MENITQHEKDLPVKYIQTIFQDPLINRHWKKIAELLGIPKIYIEKLKMEVMLKGHRDADIMHDIFIYWRIEYQADATIENLWKLFANDKELENVTKKYQSWIEGNVRPNQPLKWDDLDYQTKELILTKPISFMGKKDSLLNISNNLETPKFLNLLRKTFCSATLINVINNGDYEITKDSIPKTCSAYIPRTLNLKRQVDPKIFSVSQESDIFLLKGIELRELSVLAGNHNTVVSGSQTRKVTAPCIILEDEDHVDVILKRTTKSVHVISYETGKYYWLQSNGSINLLKNYLVCEAEYFTENALLDEFNKPNRSTICISDSSGAGKSTFLASIARKVREIFPDRVVLFVQMAELLLLLSKYDNVDEVFWELLARELSNNELGYHLLLHMFFCDKVAKELFVDGFDKGLLKGKQYVVDILEGIVTFPNVRLCVTTQSDIQNELEVTFSVFAYNFAPVTLHEQIKFLCECWNHSGTDHYKERLENYARRCISLVDISHSEVTGVPLICFMLADIYASEAMEYASCGKYPRLSMQKSISIFSIYRDYMSTILHPINQVQKRSLFYLAITSIFECCDDIVPKSWDNWKANKILKPPTMGNLPLFVHRSFAEYVIVEELANAIKGTILPQKYSQEVLKILSSVLKTDCYNFRETKFREIRICYFLNDFLKNSSNAGGSEVNLSSTREQEQHIFGCAGNKSEILKACIFHEMYHLLFFVFSSSTELSCTVVTKKQWKKILLIASRYASLLTVENLMQRYSHNEVCEMNFNDWKLANVKLTPLHVAIQRGSSAHFQYFFKVYSTKLHFIPGLIHVALENSEHQTSDIINAKIGIIREIIEKLGKSLLNETLEQNQSPILMDKIHFKLLKFIVSAGADMTSLTTTNSNLAHQVGTYMNSLDYHNFVNFLLYKRKESLLRDLNSSQETAFQIALENICVLPETVALLSKSLAATENIEKGYKGSFLYHLIKNNYTRQAIEKALKHTTSWPNLVYKCGSVSLLHVAVSFGNFQATSLFIDKGSNCNAVDENQETPLHIACNLEQNHKIDSSVASAIIDLLTEHGADVNVPDKNGYTPLSYILDQIK